MSFFLDIDDFISNLSPEETLTVSSGNVYCGCPEFITKNRKVYGFSLVNKQKMQNYFYIFYSLLGPIAAEGFFKWE